MKLFLIFIVSSFLAEAGKNKEKTNVRKNVRKQYRKCKRQNCAESCADTSKHNEDCFTCLESMCKIPRNVSKMHECMGNSCKAQCKDVDSESCKTCKVEKCTNKARQAARKAAGGAPKLRPLAVLDKFVCGPQRRNCMDVQSGAKAQHRCALGFCYKKCILEPINELDCEDCIRTMCPRASDNFSCVAAEHDNKYFFCSTAENCTGNDTGGVPVANKSCPENTYCCSWGE